MTEVDAQARCRPTGEPDGELVQRLRGTVADRMAQQAGRDGAMTAAARAAAGPGTDPRGAGEEAAAALTSGRPPLDQAAEQQVADRVYADLWGLGGFQPYLDDPGSSRSTPTAATRCSSSTPAATAPGSRRSRPATRS